MSVQAKWVAEEEIVFEGRYFLSAGDEILVDGKPARILGRGSDVGARIRPGLAAETRVLFRFI